MLSVTGVTGGLKNVAAVELRVELDGTICRATYAGTLGRVVLSPELGRGTVELDGTTCRAGVYLLILGTLVLLEPLPLSRATSLSPMGARLSSNSSLVAASHFAPLAPGTASSPSNAMYKISLPATALSPLGAFGPVSTPAQSWPIEREASPVDTPPFISPHTP